MATADDTPSHYAVLGLESTANIREIKRAFITKQREHHPDRNSTPNDLVARINAAWQVLSDPAERIEYDLEMGFRENNLDTRQQLHQYRKKHAERVRESQVESANASRQIEAKVYIRDGKKKLKDAGLIIAKARYGFLTRSQHAKRSSMEEFTAEMKDISSEAVDDDTPEEQVTEELWIDVTDALQCMVQHRGRDGGFIEIEDGVDKSRLEGFYDPCPEKAGSRHLEVEYMFRRQFHFGRAENFEYLILPSQSHVVDVFKFEEKNDGTTSEQKSSTDEINGKVGFVQRASLQDLVTYGGSGRSRGGGSSSGSYGGKEWVVVGLHVGLACLILSRKVDGSRYVDWCQSILSSVRPGR